MCLLYVRKGSGSIPSLPSILMDKRTSAYYGGGLLSGNCLTTYTGTTFSFSMVSSSWQIGVQNFFLSGGTGK